jgi:hypothetical protein
MRDAKAEFVPLERMFGTLTKGMAFGETAMCLEPKKRFYNAIALTECWLM